MSQYATIPVTPTAIVFDPLALTLEPAGPLLERRLSDMEDLFADSDAWRSALAAGNPVVYTVAASLVPETGRELPQSITTIHPGSTGGELWMTKGHQHAEDQGEIYLAIKGDGLLVMFDGTESSCIEMSPNTIGYIPPGWAHRSVNVGTSPYSFLAVYPGSAGHNYNWVLENGLGKRIYEDGANGYRLADYFGEAPEASTC